MIFLKAVKQFFIIGHAVIFDRIAVIIILISVLFFSINGAINNENITVFSYKIALIIYSAILLIYFAIGIAFEYNKIKKQDIIKREEHEEKERLKREIEIEIQNSYKEGYYYFFDLLTGKSRLAYVFLEKNKWFLTLHTTPDSRKEAAIIPTVRNKNTNKDIPIKIDFNDGSILILRHADFFTDCSYLNSGYKKLTHFKSIYLGNYTYAPLIIDENAIPSAHLSKLNKYSVFKRVPNKKTGDEHTWEYHFPIPHKEENLEALFCFCNTKYVNIIIDKCDKYKKHLSEKEAREQLLSIIEEGNKCQHL
jgi:hypothetical protein